MSQGSCQCGHYEGKDRPPFVILPVDSREARQFTDEDIVFLHSYANLVAVQMITSAVNCRPLKG